jgi:hypothetical protein
VGLGRKGAGRRIFGSMVVWSMNIRVDEFTGRRTKYSQAFSILMSD